LDLSSQGVRNPVGCFEGLSLNKSQIGLWPSVYFCSSSTSLKAFKTMHIDARRIMLRLFLEQNSTSQIHRVSGHGISHVALPTFWNSPTV
jgi:hypothetical protein